MIEEAHEEIQKNGLAPRKSMYWSFNKMWGRHS